jgi:hypothetical protein
LRSAFGLNAENVAELGDHARAAHRPSPSVGQLSDVDGAGHVRVAMSEEECDLVDALPREEPPADDGVPLMRNSA